MDMMSWTSMTILLVRILNIERVVEEMQGQESLERNVLLLPSP